MENQFLKLAIMALINISPFIGLAAEPAAADSSSSTKNLERPWNLVKTEDLGVGIKWGNLTGIDSKYWISENRAWEFAIASADNNTLLGVDYLMHFREVTAEMIKDRIAKNIAPYVGVGLLATFGDNKSSTKLFDHEENKVNSALRVPFGVEYLPTNIRVGFFAELGLGFGIAPKTYTFATGDVGARFYF
jgi:hypothetical protein